MTEHHHHHHEDVVNMLELDARVFGPHLDEVTAWAAQAHHLPQGTPKKIADVGSGPGAYTLALARRFPEAEIVAIDMSPVMLDHLRAAAREQGLNDRLHLVQADLDAAWPQVEGVDLAWAASSLHHVADPGRVLADLHAALNPGGLLVVVEMDGMPRFLPGDPGLEERCREAAKQAGWNAYPDWQPHLERAGFEMAGRRTFTFRGEPDSPHTRQYARIVLGRFRMAFADRLPAGDLATLDRLLAGDGPQALATRTDLDVRGGRTVWAARRPLDGEATGG